MPNIKPQQDDDLGRRLGSDEAADFLGISRKTLPPWRSRGVGPAFVKVGRKVVYLEADLRRYLDENRKARA